MVLPSEDPDGLFSDELIERAFNGLKGKKVASALLGMSCFPKWFLEKQNVSLVSSLNELNVENEAEQYAFECLLTKLIDEEVKDMPRSLFLGTSRAEDLKIVKKGSCLSEDLIRKRIAVPSSNPILFILKNKHNDLMESCKMIGQCSTLALQHPRLQQFFYETVYSMLKEQFDSITDETRYHLTYHELVLLLKSSMKDSPSPTAFAYALFALMTMIAVVGEQDPALCRDDLHEILSLDIIPEKYSKIEEIQSAYYAGLVKIPPPLLAQRKEIIENAFENLPLVQKPYFLREIKYEKPTSEEIKKHIEILRQPGPVGRKIESCVAICGAVDAGFNQEIVSDGIKEMLEGIVTDQRLLTWLLVLLFICERPKNAIKSPRSATGLNRFGETSAFGWAIDNISRTISDCLLNAKKLPRLDWKKLDFDFGKQWLQFVETHCLYEWFLERLEERNKLGFNESDIHRVAEKAMVSFKGDSCESQVRLLKVLREADGFCDFQLKLLKQEVINSEQVWVDGRNDISSWRLRAQIGMNDVPLDLMFNFLNEKQPWNSTILQNLVSLISNLNDADAEIALEALEDISLKTLNELWNIAAAFYGRRAFQFLSQLLFRLLTKQPIGITDEKRYGWLIAEAKEKDTMEQLERTMWRVFKQLPDEVQHFLTTITY